MPDYAAGKMDEVEAKSRRNQQMIDIVVWRKKSEHGCYGCSSGCTDGSTPYNVRGRTSTKAARVYG